MWVVTKIRVTCPSSPYQLEGEVWYKRPLYIRYRFGHLCFMVGRPAESVQGMLKRELNLLTLRHHYPFDKEVGDEYDGCMTFEEMKRHTAGLLDFGDIKEGE